MSAQELPPQRDAELRTIAMPADTNAYGDIFGGWLLAQMDLAAGSFAIMRARGRVATVGLAVIKPHTGPFDDPVHHVEQATDLHRLKQRILAPSSRKNGVYLRQGR